MKRTLGVVGAAVSLIVLTGGAGAWILHSHPARIAEIVDAWSPSIVDVSNSDASQGAPFRKFMVNLRAGLIGLAVRGSDDPSLRSAFARHLVALALQARAEDNVRRRIIERAFSAIDAASRASGRPLTADFAIAKAHLAAAALEVGATQLAERENYLAIDALSRITQNESPIWRARVIAHRLEGELAANASDSKRVQTALDAALAAADELAALPDRPNAFWLRAQIKRDLGDLARARGDAEAAGALFSEAIDDALAGGDEGANGRKTGEFLAICNLKLGDLLRAEENWRGKLAHYEKARSLIANLLADDPENREWLRLAGVVNNRIGDVRMAKDDYLFARAAYGEALTYATLVVDGAPDVTADLRDLALTHSNLSDAHHALGDFRAALTNSDKEIALYLKLATMDEDSFTEKRDLAIAYLKLGDLRTDMGDAIGAAVAYDAARDAISETKGIGAAAPLHKLIEERRTAANEYLEEQRVLSTH